MGHPVPADRRFSGLVNWRRDPCEMLLKDDFKFNVTNTLLCDNRATARVAEDPICSNKTRHIEVRYKKVQELMDRKKTKV